MLNISSYDVAELEVATREAIFWLYQNPLGTVERITGERLKHVAKSVGLEIPPEFPVKTED